MTRATDYTNAAQQRLVLVMLALFDDLVQGIAPSALARTVGCSNQVMTRDLDNLRTAGIAERDEVTGHWRLTPRLPQQAIKAWQSIDRAEKRLAAAKARFNHNPD
jgi:DNA-binding IclR family transcriptional regulator